MTTTVKNLLTGALKISGLVGAGQTPQAYLLSDILEAMNDMLSLWSSEGLSYAISEDLTLTQGQAVHTIKSGGDLDTTTPIRVLPSAIKINNFEIPLNPIDFSTYDAIQNKTTTGRPGAMLFDPLTQTLSFYYVPDQAYIMSLSSIKSFGSYTINQTMNLPDGYESAVKYNTALLFAGTVGRTLPPSSVNMAMSTFKNIKNRSAAFNLKRRTITDPTGNGSGNNPNVNALFNR